MSFCRLRGRRRLCGSRDRNLEDQNGLRLNISVGCSRSGVKRLHRQIYAVLNRRSQPHSDQFAGDYTGLKNLVTHPKHAVER